MDAPRRLRSSGDGERAALRERAAKLLEDFNAAPAGDDRVRAGILERLLGSSNGVVIRPPFQAEIGANIHFDEACFVNSDCTILDRARVRIGAFTQISPGVQILTALPIPAEDGEEAGRAVVIGRNVWVGAHAVILPGVKIGDDAIISAGAVVSQDVLEGATVAGDPARPII